jgi:hypothetical protein
VSFGNIFNIHVGVDKASTSYLDYLIENFKHTAHDASRLIFYCYAIDEEAFDFFENDNRFLGCYTVHKMQGSYRLKSWQDFKVYLKAKVTQRSQLGGSNGHAAALNAMTKNFKSLKGHNIIADSDVAMLVHGWDLITEKQLKKYHLFGTSYENMGGFSSGHSKVQTYKNFPNANWLAISSECDFQNFDWMPKKEKNIKISDVKKSKIYGLPMGYEMVCDGGWALPSYCDNLGYSSKALLHVKPSDSNVQVLKTKNDYNEEYQLDGRAFVGHQRGGSRHLFRQSKVSVEFYNKVEDAVGTP